jgi:predicted enzyme related to lactoylglutathione lyase
MKAPQAGEFCWNELATTEIKKAKDFYGKLCGWQFTEHTTDGNSYTMIKKGEKEFGGMWQIPNDQAANIPPHWMGYILVENLDKTVEEAQKLGGKVTMPVTKVGEMGQFAVIQDPTGAHIAFWQSLGQHSCGI